MRSASEVEQNIVSVERILHYIELPPEAPWEVPGTVPEDWPSKGELEFRYALEPCSLHNVRELNIIADLRAGNTRRDTAPSSIWC